MLPSGRPLIRPMQAMIKTMAAPISGGEVKSQVAMALKSPKPSSEEPEADFYLHDQEANTHNMPKSILFNRLAPDHVPSALELFLGPYLDVEPLKRAVGLDAAEARPFYKERLENAVEAGNSFIALDGDSKKPLGVIINEKLLRGRYQYTSRTGDKLAKIENLLRYVEGDAFAQLPHSNSIFKIHDALVKQGYQNHGIGRTLLKMAVEEARKQDCDYIVGTSTSPLVQDLLHDKLSFQPVWSCKTMSYTDEGTQEKPFQCIAHSSPSIVFMARNLVTQPELY